MRAKRKIKKEDMCQVPGCKNKWICGWQPKRSSDKRLLICADCLCANVDDDRLWKLVGLKRPEYFPKAKTETKTETINHKPKKEGKPAWQDILDKWFERKVYPKPAFMNSKRWTYWLSIGGKKPEGDSRKFDKTLQAVTTGNFSKLKTKKKSTKVRRKK